MSSAHYDAVVVGGGFYGASLSLFLREYFDRVLLVEQGPELMTRASYANQARVHGGYHYPRSILTALRSRVNYRRFLQDFPGCIDRSFTKYYAIARQPSKVTARQFQQFCDRVGAPLKRAPKDIRALFNDELIEEVFEAVDECAFDAVKLKDELSFRLRDRQVECLLESSVERFATRVDGTIVVTLTRGAASSEVSASLLVNATYARLNKLLDASGLPRIPLKHELAEITLVEVPRQLQHLGITVMDGPYFSVMPFPPRGLHSFSHVRYTPHCAWQDSADRPYAEARSSDRQTSFVHMMKDAQRYLPSLKECRYVDSLWETKTVLPQSEVDDSRPILLKQFDRAPSCYSVLGAKIDSVYDVQDRLLEVLRLRAVATS